MRHTITNCLSVMFLCISAAFVAGDAMAVDGVIEINQARAIAGGVTPGDAAGFPVTLDQSGSYRLTGDLAPTGPAANVIEIDADNVRLDLNGFRISGGTTCTDTVTIPNVVNCTPAGSAVAGITGSAASNVWIGNGTIQGMIDAGIELPTTLGVTLVDLVISMAADPLACVRLGDVATVRRSRIELCAADALQAGFATTVVDSRAGRSNGLGMNLGNTVEIRSSEAVLNGATGVSCGGPAVLVGNRMVGNGGNGLVVTNVAGATLSENVFTSNISTGAVLTNGSNYGANIFEANGAAPVTGGVSRGDNVCNGAAC